MGTNYSVDKSAPPGGDLLYVQDTGCCVQPSFSAQKPQCLSTLPAKDWETFHNTVAEAAGKMWSERSQFFGFVVLPIIVFPQIFFRAEGSDRGGLGMMVMVLSTFGFLAVFLAPRLFTIQKNQQMDRVILQACQGLASSSGANVQYRTNFVGFCKPKHAQPFRAIAISPANPVGMPGMPISVMPAGQLMSVQVPPGAGPGTVLQVQSPAGQTVQVTVPPGVAEGQTFQVQAPAVAPAVVVAEVVAPAVVKAEVVQESNPSNV